MTVTGLEAAGLFVTKELLALIIGAIIGYYLHRSQNKPEVLFFPDNKLPCNSFIKRLDGRPYVCPKVDCQYAHYEHGETSLMRIFFFLNQVNHSIDLCIYDFTLTVLADFLILLHQKRGIKVRIITDAHADRQQQQPRDAGADQRTQGLGDQIPRLQAENIPIKVNRSSGQYALMHNKFVLIDNKSIVMGSFNWTKSAVLKNHEAVIRTSDSRIVKKFVAKFAEIWKKSMNRPRN
jgi:cardiolipin hydrolase